MPAGRIEVSSLPVPKLKNLALLILLLANLLLAAVLIPNRMEQAREAEQIRRSLQDLCAGQQVAVDPAAIPDTVTLYALELSEDNRSGLQAATALLGEQVLVQDDSTRYLSQYSARTGTCQVGRSGSFRAVLGAARRFGTCPGQPKSC